MKHINKTLVFALGGLGEVGKNMYVVMHNSEIIIGTDKDKNVLDIYYINTNFNNTTETISKVTNTEKVTSSSQKVSYKVKKRKSLPESEWCIKENSHETLIDKKTFEIAQSIKDGKLSDVAPTLLTLLDKKVPKEMTGTILIDK